MRKLIAVFVGSLLVAVTAWVVAPYFDAGPDGRAIPGRPETTGPSGRDDEAEEESHTAEGEAREATEIAKARAAAFGHARAAGLIGLERPIRSIPNPGWTVEHVWSGTDDDWEPAIAADPNAPYVYMLTTRYSGPDRCPTCPSPSIVLRVSADGGKTWGPDRYLCVCKAVHHGQFDPQIETDANGTVYATWLQGFEPGVSVMRSTDHGETWSEPVSVPNAWSDKPWLAVSPSGRHVFVAYNGPSHGDSFVAASHDGGATLVATKVTDRNRYFFAGGGWVSNDGRHVAFAESDFDQQYVGPIHSDAVVSDDGGKTWRVIRLATGQRQPNCTSEGCYDGFYGPTPTLAGDAKGDLVFVYAANGAPRAPQQIYLTRSTDGGQTWDQPTAVSPARANAVFPAATSGGPGDFRVWWMDTRTGRWNVWFTRTTDGGVTWSHPIRLSNAVSGTPYKSRRGFLEAYGDYGEIDVTDTGRTIAIWGEGTSYAGPGNVWFTRER